MVRPAPPGVWRSTMKVSAAPTRAERKGSRAALPGQSEARRASSACWAAAGKDPGFTPLSLLELLRRRGRYRPEELERLRLAEPVDLPRLKGRWLSALDSAERFGRSRPPEEVGCLYYSRRERRFVEPEAGAALDGDVLPHFGRPGGVLPRMA